jgi:hypothetical protein
MKKIIQAIPFELKLKLRSLGWQKVSYSDLNHIVHYLSANFIRPKESDNLELPEDNLSAKQLNYELKTYSPYFHREFVVEIKEPTIVEPLMGGVISKKNAIVEECYALPIGQLIPLPYLTVAMVNKKRSITSIPKAVHLRHGWGDNTYGHFYLDILPKLALLKRLDIFQDCPILVAKKLWQTDYFQTAIQISGISHRVWIVQDKEYIKVDNLIAVQSNILRKETFYESLDFMNLSSIANDIDFEANRKIFIVRNDKMKRRLKNRDEVTLLARNKGFEIVEPSQFTLMQQIKIFAEARWVAGEQSSAFTNIIYRQGNPLNVLELYPPFHVSTCVFIICQRLGYTYQSIRDLKGDNNNEYNIDTTILSNCLDTMYA